MVAGTHAPQASPGGALWVRTSQGSTRSTVGTCVAARPGQAQCSSAAKGGALYRAACRLRISGERHQGWGPALAMRAAPRWSLAEAGSRGDDLSGRGARAIGQQGVMELEKAQEGEDAGTDSEGKVPVSASSELLEDMQAGPDYLSDVELQSVVADIASLDSQSSTVVQQVAEHARLLAEASRKLRARAQATRLEAAKLRKVARMQAAEELRRREDARVTRARADEEGRRRLEQAQGRAAAVQAQAAAAQAQVAEEVQELQAQVEELRRQRQQEQEERERLEAERQALLEELQGLQGAGDGEREQPGPAAQGGANGVVVPEVANGASAAALGAAVLPFLFPNGKTSGAEMDNALICPPAREHGDPVAAPEETTRSSDSGAGSPGLPRQSATAAQPAGTSNGTATSHLEHMEPRSSMAGEGEGQWQVTEDLECSIAHPGAMSCTKVVVKKDPGARVACVAMETTVRCNGDGCAVPSLDTEDFTALAMATLADHANELKHSTRFQGVPADLDPRIFERRKEIEELLQGGEVVTCKAMDPPSKFGHESFIVDLRNKATGKQIRAMFKPRIEGDADGWHRANVEWVAYELNLLLGMDYIPPVAYRKGGVDLGAGLTYEEGAFIYWVPGARELQEVPAPAWGVSVARLLSDTRILDILLNNSDRHHGHFLLGEHWTDGSKRVVLIDHAAGFRKEATVNMEHDNAFQTGPVKCVSAHTYLRLRFLDRVMVEEKFRDMLSPREIAGLMERKAKVLRYLDRLVQERGYHRTVVE